MAAVALYSSAQSISGVGQSSKNKLPEIGVVAADAISIDKEMEIGDILMRQMRAQAPVISDPLLDEYLQDIGNRLVAQAQNVKFPFTFFLLNNKDINAFAFFGGHIGIHTGLIFHADNESELASVLAHEVSHVTQRHIARSIQARQKSTPLQIASMFGGLLLAMASPEAGIAAIQASNAAAAQASINYTRSNEKEADRIGIQILAQAGYDPRAAASFFGKLASQTRNRSKPLAFLLTHPLPESRIADARTRANTMGGNFNSDSMNFHLAKARVIARYFSAPNTNIALFKEQLDKQSYVYEEAAKYGLALSYLANDNIEAADAIITQLRQTYPDNLFFVDTATDIALAQHQHDKALLMLSTMQKRYPNNQVVALNYANAAIEAKHYDTAIEVLKDFLLLKPNHYLAIQLLTEAYRKNQQPLEMHQHKAEMFALAGAYKRAIDELHTAYNFANERHLEKQRIKARIDQFRSAQDRLKAL
ncbi:M48 family metalloprotease [Aestuariibacter sp. AA17]|uniref:Putative beta-barrel assembly-enhancing protease n=1 Tax=Fluctibacter corallii TaxID=2984329 RepID=A0ABT3A5U4_9ALTE|nr:M48 family metalloprotease [Aestuariibacter sp. AA17]MCV2884046.1 M48 family metalloprotease [Aestuariibacter sp. AA17]